MSDTLRETPDLETSSADYASRFGGRAGRYLLAVQSCAIREVLSDLRPGTALDVGGGHGQLVDELRALGWRVTVLGSHEQCGVNLRELHGKRDCRFVAGDLLELPFPARAFDLTIAVRLLAHVAAWRCLLEEMCRVARRSVVVDYPSVNGLNALTPLLFGLKRAIEGNTRTYTSFCHADIAAVMAADSFAVSRQIKQFFLPMVLHRATAAAAPLRWAEAAARWSGLTRAFGSPVVLRADRQ